MLALRRFVSPLLLAAVPHIASSQQYDPALYAALRWRLIGPFRGGRTVAAAGVPGQPSVFYIGVNDGGVWKTTDYGRTWVPIFDDQPTGSIGALAVAPSDPKVLYVGSGEGLQRPDLSVGGATWRAVTTGLPSAQDGLGRIGLGVSPSEPARMYAVVGAAKGGGLYRSDDGGERWRLVNADPRLWGRDGDFNEVKVDPKNADVVYVANVVTWKSADGGRTFVGWRGAPGGDDYHRLWINPDDPRIILLAGDQGAVVTVNGGETWSSWYNQPTAQFYHVSTDNGFPYRVYGGQQESGRRALRVGATTGRSRSANGTRSAPRSTATSHPTRCTRTSSTAARWRASTGARARCRRCHPSPCGRGSTAGSGPCRSCSRRWTRMSCISARTCCSGRWTAAGAGRRSAPISRARRTMCLRTWGRSRRSTPKRASTAG